MRRAPAGLLVYFMAMLFTGASCTVLFGDFKVGATSGTGGSGASGSSSVGGAGGMTTSTTGTGGCSSPMGCPAPSGVCKVATCNGGACGEANAMLGASCTDPNNANAKVCDAAGACVECAAATDCTDPPEPCIAAACNAGVCGTSNIADLTPLSAASQNPGDCMVIVCDGMGGTKTAFDDLDIPNDMTVCTTDTCNGGVKVHTPTSGSCNENGGKVCATLGGAKQGTCVECNVNADCTVAGEVCDPMGSGVCVPVSCGDTIKNGTETDTDCGGSCSKCPNTKTCSVDDDCQSGFCNGTTCAPCTGDAQCPSNQFCNVMMNAGTCVADKMDGQSCANDSHCESGFCVDGVCCDTACNGACKACSTAKKGSGLNGECGDIGAGGDPDNECTADPVSTCDQTGACDGLGACQLHPAATLCTPPACSGVVQVAAGQCNGSGTCVPGNTVNCAPYNCNAGACLTMCSSGVDCAAGNYCNGMSQCVAKKAPGASCLGPNECQDGNCTDGFCCDTACTGVCQACSAAKTGGANGTCSNILFGVDPDNECSGSTNCDGLGACAKLSTGEPCLQSSQCESGHCVDGVCCGSGCPMKCMTCNKPGFPGMCVNITSGTDPDNECAAPMSVCSGGLCKGALGDTCVVGSDCASGWCRDNVCCTESCNGICRKCNLPGNVGTCLDVPAGTDPDNECPIATPNCNGSGACQ